MLDKLFARFREQPETPENLSGLQLAFAALLVEAARGDDEYTDKERDLIDHIMMRQFGLDITAAQSARAEAETAQESSNDLYGFSRVVKEELDREGKCKLIEDMWVIALSDDDRAPYEEMIIRRLIGLIHLEDTDSTAARRRAEARLAAGE